MSAAGDPTTRREAWAQALLEERATQLARKPESEAAPVITRLVVSTGGALYGLPLSWLARVLPYRRLTPTPSANPAFLGAMARAGAFYLIYDLARTIDARAPIESGGHIVLLRRADPKVGLRVNEALGVADLRPLEERESASLPPSHPSVSGFARHPDGRMVSLIDLTKMLAPLSRQTGEGGP